MSYQEIAEAIKRKYGFPAADYTIKESQMCLEVQLTAAQAATLHSVRQLKAYAETARIRAAQDLECPLDHLAPLGYQLHGSGVDFFGAPEMVDRFLEQVFFGK